jgi:hypothetical protein
MRIGVAAARLVSVACAFGSANRLTASYGSRAARATAV